MPIFKKGDKLMAKKEEKKPTEEKAKGLPPTETDEEKDAPAAGDSEQKSDGEKSASESAQETPEKASADESEKTPAEAEKLPETGTEKPAEASGEPPAEKSADSTETDADKAETSAAEPPAASADPVQNTELLEVKAQLAAYKSGVRGDVVEDAVCLAVHDAQKAGELTEKTVLEALKGVLERHPEWKNTVESTAGFRVGADGSQKPPASDDAISQIFGNK